MAVLNNGNLAVTKSNGLLGLPHFRNSRVATSLWEPIYQNLFTVQLVPPLGLEDRSEERVNIILEGLKNVSGLETSKSSGVVEQKYKFATRSFAGAAPDKTTLDISMTFQLNLSYDNGTPENYTYKFLRQWVDLVYDPLTGRQGLKKDYCAPSMTVTIHDRAGTPYMQYQLYQVIPTGNVGAFDLNYTNTNLLEVNFGLRCDYWDEAML